MSDMGLVRKNNEDNFQISRDLSVEPMRWINNEACLLTPQGALLVVADGMGGANAGEVASQIAIDTIKELFSPAAIAAVDLHNTQAINDFMRYVVVEADARIKSTAAVRPETYGMGTTLVIGWLIEGKLYMAWCGDSRGYVFNRANTLRRLTKDHSYVQSLVDMGQLTDDQAFDHPQGNVITRCLCDSPTVAEADVLPEPYNVADGDIILLCTDGLCGMIRDHEIAQILNAGPDSDLRAVGQNLIDGALRAGGADNVTIAMLQVVSGGVRAGSTTPPPIKRVAPEASPQQPAPMAPQPAPMAPQQPPITPQAATPSATSPQGAPQAAPRPGAPDANPPLVGAAPKKKSNLPLILTASIGGVLIGAASYFYLNSNGNIFVKDTTVQSAPIDLINREGGVNDPGRPHEETSGNDVTPTPPSDQPSNTESAPDESSDTKPGGSPNSSTTGIASQVGAAFSSQNRPDLEEPEIEDATLPATLPQKYIVKEGDTFTTIMDRLKLNKSQRKRVIKINEKIYKDRNAKFDPKKLVPGQEIYFKENPSK